MKTTVAKILSLSEEEYQEMVFDLWMRWCINKAWNRTNDLQKLLSNTALNAWWLQELEKIEIDYLDLVSLYEGSITKDEAVRMFNKEIVTIHRLNCPTLEKSARVMNVLPITKND